MKIADSVDEMVFDLLEVPIEDKDIEGTADNTTIDGNVFTDYLWLKKQFTQKWSLMCKDDYTQLRGFYTRQWENAEVPTYKLYVGNDIRETDTASGNPLQITNNTEYDAPILDFKLNGNTEQTTYSGKNLFDKSLYIGNYHASYTELSNGVRSTTTTAGTAYVAIQIPNSDALLGKTATLKVTKSASAGVSIYQSKGASSVWGMVGSINGTNTQGTFTFPASYSDDCTCFAILFYCSSQTVGTNIDFTDIQLELGQTATAYEPYVGGIASPNPDYPQAVNVVSGEQVVKVEGKNLFDKTTATQGKFVNASGIITNDATALVSDYIHIEPNTDYYVSGRTLWNSFALYDGSKTFIERRNLSYVNGVINITNTSCAYIRINASIGDLNNIQLELGNQATTYEPYQGQSYTIDLDTYELAKIGTYQDYIWNDNGTWKVHKAVGKVDLGSLTYTGGTSNQGYIYSTTGITGIKYVSVNTELGAIISTDYTLHTASGMWDTHGFIAVDTAKVAITNKTASPTGTAYYALATPTDTAITENALITQLNAIVQASLPVGLNNVSNISIAPNLAGEMELTYELIHEKETIIRDTTPVRLTLTDGGVINPCECRQNVQITMRETTQ